MAKIKQRSWFLDDGYGDVKGYNGEGTNEAYNPDTDTLWDRLIKRGELLVPYHVVPYIKPKNRREEGLVDPLSHIVVTEFEEDGSPGQKWLVGQGAIDQDLNAKWSGEEDKHGNFKFRVYLKACLGLMAREEQTVVDCLGWGLPVDYEENADRKDFLKKTIVGPWHNCHILLANGEELNRRVNVMDLLIRKQAECALYDQYLDNDANITDQNFPYQFNIVADVGAGTFNVFAMRNMKPVDGLCFQTNDGMFGEKGAYQLIRNSLENLRGGPVSDLQIPNIIKSGIFLNAGSQEVGIKNIVNTAFEIHANNLVSILQTSLKNVWTQVYRVIWVGGGVEQEKEYITKQMGTQVVQIFGDRFSNARGGRKIVLRYLQAKAEKAKQAGKITGNVGQTEVNA